MVCCVLPHVSSSRIPVSVPPRWLKAAPFATWWRQHRAKPQPRCPWMTGTQETPDFPEKAGDFHTTTGFDP